MSLPKRNSADGRCYWMKPEVQEELQPLFDQCIQDAIDGRITRLDSLWPPVVVSSEGAPFEVWQLLRTWTEAQRAETLDAEKAIAFSENLRRQSRWGEIDHHLLDMLQRELQEKYFIVTGNEDDHFWDREYSLKPGIRAEQVPEPLLRFACYVAVSYKVYGMDFQYLDANYLFGLVENMRKTKSSVKQLFIPGMLFENMGLTYLGPVDGHNMRQMMKLFNEAKRVEGPVVVHVLTKKGRGYEPASAHPDRFHGTGPFDIKTGRVLQKKTVPGYTDVFSKALVSLGEKNKKLTAITAAMPDGTGLVEFSRRFPDRFFDVGIAEEHAVSFAAGLALGGLVPVVAIYSSFLQRAVDQILHDVCMQKLHVIFAVDRAGLVGADGETHQGCFDLSYLSMMPNMTVLAPKNDRELEEMLAFAVSFDGPIAIRYPRGNAHQGLREYQAPVEYGRSEIIRKGKKIAVLGVGSMIPSCMEICKGLKDDGYDPTFVNARFVKPLDVDLLDELAKDHSLFVTVEENVKSGGYGEHVSAYMEACHPEIRVLSAAVWDRFVPQGNVESLRSRIGLGVEDIRQAIEDSEELREQ